MPIANKLAYMAADVKTQTSVFRKNISDYPQYSELETATIAIAKTLPAIAPRLQVMFWRICSKYLGVII